GGDDHQDPRLAGRRRACGSAADALLHHACHTGAADRAGRSRLPRLAGGGSQRGGSLNKLALLLVVLSAAVTAAYAETFPDRPIKLIVAYPAGGPTDTVARVATQGIAEKLGQAMVIENVAGAGGRIGTRDVARAAPDGYTLLLGGTNDNALTPVIYKSL